MARVKINSNYFVVSKKLDNIRYFFKRGHTLRLAWDRLKWHWLPKYGIAPRFPQTVDIETSLGCQLRCPMCSREQMVSKFAGGGNMNYDMYKAIIDECAANNVFSIKLSWRGEPTVHPRLIDMVRYAKDKGIKDVAFLTNGGLLNEERTRALIDAGVDWISFSIDGMYEDYERIRKPITFPQIVETVKRIHTIKKTEGRTKPLVRIQTISGALERNPDYFSFWEPWVDRISVIAEQHRDQPELIKHDPDYVCQSPFQRVFITWDGKIAPCHGDYHLHHNMGRFGEVSIKEAWDGEKFRKLRHDMWNKDRLQYEACRLCADGGEYVGDKLNIDGRTIPVIRYLENEDAKADMKSAS